MIKTIFKGVVNGQEFDNINDYNAAVQEASKNGDIISASTSTQQVMCDCDDDYECHHCGGDACQCKQSMPTGTNTSVLDLLNSISDEFKTYKAYIDNVLKLKNGKVNTTEIADSMKATYNLDDLNGDDSDDSLLDNLSTDLYYKSKRLKNDYTVEQRKEIISAMCVDNEMKRLESLMDVNDNTINSLEKEADELRDKLDAVEHKLDVIYNSNDMLSIVYDYYDDIKTIKE